MSTNVTKFGIRLGLPELNGKSNQEIRRFFVEKGFTRDKFDEDDEETPLFTEEYCTHLSVNKTYPIRGYNGGWGVEHLLYYEKDGEEKGDSMRSLNHIYEESKKLADEYGRDMEDVYVFSYTYYTGGDEPVFFDNK